MSTQEKEASGRQNSYPYLDLLRILGCLLVVGVHICASNIENLPLPSPELFITNALSHLSIIGVPLFVMISGSLLLHPDYELSYKKLLCRKIPRLVLIYFIWLVVYNLMNCYQEGYGYSLSSLKQHVILNSLLGNGIYHLWFLPMMVGLYLVTPLLRKIAPDKELCRYFLILYFIGTIFFPTILKFNFRFKTIAESLCQRIPYRMLTGYIGYYLLGFTLHYHYPLGFSKKSDEEDLSPLPAAQSGKNALPRPACCRKQQFSLSRPVHKKRLLASLTVLISWCAGFLISYYRALGRGVFSQILNDPLTINHLLSAAGLFLLVQSFDSDLLKKVRAVRVLKYLSSLTLGIYLVHPAILMVSHWLGIRLSCLHPLLAIPLGTFAVSVISGLLVALLKKIPVLRYIVM